MALCSNDVAAIITVVRVVSNDFVAAVCRPVLVATGRLPAAFVSTALSYTPHMKIAKQRNAELLL